jgi:polyribonucleotide 5'-hydroxyl-kinase
MASKPTEYVLGPEKELRCEVNDTKLTVKLTRGTAEIFGIEMAVNKEYVFLDESFAIFTWYGCTLECVSNNATMYISDSTPMVAYVNTHAQLEARRDVAYGNRDYGPRVCILIYHILLF